MSSHRDSDDLGPTEHRGAVPAAVVVVSTVPDDRMIAVPLDTPFRRKAPSRLGDPADDGGGDDGADPSLSSASAPATSPPAGLAAVSASDSSSDSKKSRKSGRRGIADDLEPGGIGVAAGGTGSSVTGCLILCWIVLVVFTLTMVFIAMSLVGTPPGGGTRLKVIGPAVFAGPGTRTDILAVCHPRWHGIRAATYQMGVAVIESADLSTPAAQAELAEELRMRGTKVVVFNGVVPGTLEACSALRKALPGLRTGLTFHGSFAQHSLTTEGQLLSTLVDAASGDPQTRPLWRLGFLKESIAPWLAEFAHAPAFPLANVRRPLALRLGKFSSLDGLVHVGVFSKNSGLKNVINQLAAACSLGPRVVVHTVAMPRAEAPYIERFCPAGIVAHGPEGNLPHFDMLLLMSAMDVNLYVSLTECHPMVVLESISTGTPCISSDVSSIYDGEPDLHRQLVVRKHEDVADIAAVLNRVIANLTALTAEQPAFLDRLNARSLGLWHRFLNASLPPVPRAPPIEQPGGSLLPNPEDEARFRRLADLTQSADLAHQQRDEAATATAVDEAEAVAVAEAEAAAVAKAGKKTNAKAHADVDADAEAEAVRKIKGGPKMTPPKKPLKVCFATYELGGETGGGMGTLLTGLLRDLTRGGTHCVVAADVSNLHIDRWVRYIEKEGISNTTVYHVPSVAGKSFGPDETPVDGWAASTTEQREQRAVALANRGPTNFLYMRKSVLFASALAAIHKREHCDIIELFEYAGVAYELLRARPLYFPSQRDAPKLVLRVHGSLTHIRMAEDAASAVMSSVYGTSSHAWPREASLIHAMEYFAMLRADAVIVPSSTMGRLCSKFYGMSLSRFYVLPPPLAPILAPFKELSEEIWAPAKARLSSNVYLVYGKQQAVKGTDLVVSAALQWMKEDKANATFVFVGSDMLDCGAGRACLMKPIPQELRDRFTFIDYSTPPQVAKLAVTARCAIFASRFETLGIAAHEVYKLGVPIIASRIPAYADHFTEANAFTFDPRAVTSLVDALRESVNNTAKLAKLASAPAHLAYVENVAPRYAHLLQNIEEGAFTNSLSARTLKSEAIHEIVLALLRSSHPTDVPPFY